MNKYIGLLVVGVLSASAHAGTTITWNKKGCEDIGGIWIQANSATDTDKGCDANRCNAKTFCQSSVAMNWWSAFAWCASIGAQLVDLNHACPNGLGNMSCANLVGSGNAAAWNTSIQSGQVNLITENGASIHRWWGSAPNDERHRALCEPKGSTGQ